MFKRSLPGASRDSHSPRANKISKPAPPRRAFRDSVLRHRDAPLRDRTAVDRPSPPPAPAPVADADVAMAGSPSLLSSIVTIVVGPDQRLFAAHEHVLCQAPFFADALRNQFLDPHARRIRLVDEEAEVLSCVLEFLYKGDYYPALVPDKKRNTWVLEGAVQSPDPGDAHRAATAPAAAAAVEPTLFHSGVGDVILRDTAVYCAAERYGLASLKRLALRKQGLQSGIDVATILRSARYAYANTPDHDSRLRAHYLALIIRSRRTFKRSGTMQTEMEQGSKLFFDLFVAMCNHIDDIVDVTNSHSPRTV